MDQKQPLKKSEESTDPTIQKVSNSYLPLPTYKTMGLSERHSGMKSFGTTGSMSLSQKIKRFFSKI